jgi:hypothetical protein
VRLGGLYVIEDWPWAHEQPLESLWADQIPLTRFVFELTLAIPSVPGLISEIAIDTNSVRLKRGDASVGSHGFEVSAHLHARGLRLLRGTDARNSAGAESG